MSTLTCILTQETYDKGIEKASTVWFFQQISLFLYIFDLPPEMKNSDFFKSVTCATSSHPRLEEGGPQQPLSMIMLNHDVFTGRYWLQGMTSVAVATNAIAEMVPDITRGWNGKVQKWKKRGEGEVMRKHGLEGQSSRSPILNHEDGVLKGGGKDEEVSWCRRETL